jgi:hypothetical protein
MLSNELPYCLPAIQDKNASPVGIDMQLKRKSEF